MAIEAHFPFEYTVLLLKNIVFGAHHLFVNFFGTVAAGIVRMKGKPEQPKSWNDQKVGMTDRTTGVAGTTGMIPALIYRRTDAPCAITRR
jgi:hypothetical protein